MLCTRVASLPVVTVLVEVVNGVLLLVGGGAATLVGVWPCVTVLVGIVDGVLLVGGSGVATSVGVKSPVGSTVLMLLVVLSPVEV